ncbi:MAG: transcriptional regulator [Spirochaetaceae bacterium]|jgi:hypothetical protein|nr:transcriptional regulator [Spirochaetaceae bacterium]
MNDNDIYDTTITGIKDAAHEAFSRAQIHALFSRIQHFLNPDKDKLLSLNDVRGILKPRHEVYRGMRTVPVNLIIGSEGRYKDFNTCFDPKTDSTRSRWERVATAALCGIDLPPVQLYEIGGVFFIRDGNHRVSVAVSQGIEHIDAEVICLESDIKLRPGITLPELRGQVIEYEKKIFYSETFFGDLTDCWTLDFSRTGRYDVIYNHILVHKYYLNETQIEEIPFSDALISWYNTIYIPIIAIIEEERICAQFPKRKPSDFYVWVVKRWTDLKQQYGDDYSMREAARPLINSRKGGTS